jgi:hypothetical protein
MTICHIHTKAQAGLCNSELYTSRAGHSYCARGAVSTELRKEDYLPGAVSGAASSCGRGVGWIACEPVAKSRSAESTPQVVFLSQFSSFTDR